MSIRARLTLWYGAVLLLGLALFSASTWYMLDRRLAQGVDARLAQRLQGLQTLLVAEAAEHDNSPQTLREELGEFARSTAEGALLQVRDASGADMLPPNATFTTDDWQPGPQTVERNGHRYRVQTSVSAPYRLLAATSLDDVEAILAELRRLFLWMLPLDLAAALAGGYWISRRALAPVDQMTRAVKAISVNNLAQRLDSPQTGDELQHLAETWNEVLQRLDAAIRRVKQFTADASHELRTPLALIHSTADLALRRERSPETYREALRQIRGGTERMAALTDSLLTLARADAGQLDMPLASMDLSRVVADVVQSSEALGEARGVSLAANVEGAAFADANEDGIRRLLLILIDNAVKHTPPGGMVRVSATPEAAGVVLEVRDNGEGVPAAALPHLFERFYRADPSHQGPGAGLGLAIAQAIAQAHGSEIVVESEEGQGARFSLIIQGGNQV